MCMLSTILLSRETREKLKALGKKGETYEHILRRIIHEVNIND